MTSKKLEQLVKLMDEYAQLERDCSVVAEPMTENSVRVFARIDGEVAAEAVIIDRGKWRGSEMVEVFDQCVLVTAKPSAVLSIVLSN